MTTSPPVGSFALVLHAHQPFVLGYGRWPHGSDWLCEAVVESYLPLLRVLRSPAFTATPFPLTMSFSPVLCEQLASPLFQSEYERFLRTVCACCLAPFSPENQDELQALRLWTQFYQRHPLLQDIGGDMLSLSQTDAGRTGQFNYERGDSWLFAFVGEREH
jgi:hypothetical protein